MLMSVLAFRGSVVGVEALVPICSLMLRSNVDEICREGATEGTIRPDDARFRDLIPKVSVRPPLNLRKASRVDKCNSL